MGKEWVRGFSHSFNVSTVKLYLEGNVPGVSRNKPFTMYETGLWQIDAENILNRCKALVIPIWEGKGILHPPLHPLHPT